MMVSKCLTIILFIGLLGIQFADAAEYRERCESAQGCRIMNGRCSCGYGCSSEYPYATQRDCQAALKGRRNDICMRLPCKNSGSCIQVSQDPGYKCRCEGTGFFGNRCENACPTGASQYSGVVFPYECVVI